MNNTWPSTVDEAVEILLKVLPDRYKEQVRSTERKHLLRFHFTLGPGIRNSFGLWGRNWKLNYSCCAAELRSLGLRYDNAPLQLMHPDHCSTVILQALWERLQEKGDHAKADGPAAI